VRDITDFSPRTAEAGNPVYAELGLYQTLSFDNWQGGFGTPWHTAERTNVYMRTDGQVDTRHYGIAMLMTKPTKSSSDIRADGFLEFGGDFYAYSSDGVAKFNGTSWSVVSTDDVVDLWHNGYYIFAARRNDTLIYASSSCAASSDWTETGGSTDQKGFKWIQHHDGYVYAGQFSGPDGSSGHYVSYDDSIDLSDIYTVSSDDPQIIPVGVNGMETKKGISFRGDFLIPRPDGIYRVDKDRSAARRVLNYADQTSTDNFRSYAEFNGQLVYPVRDVLLQWNGSREVPISVPYLTDTWPYVSYGRYDNLVRVGRFLFLTARTNETPYEEHILCWDNVGWHKMAEPVTDGASTIIAMGYDTTNNRLWYCVEDGSGDCEIYYIPLQDNSEFPYPDFPTTGTHSLIFPRIAAGFRQITKSSPGFLIRASNCDTDSYLKIYYALDGGGWTAWGGNDGVSNVMSSDGVKAFTNPLGSTGGHSTIEYKYIQFRIDFVTNVSTGTPVLEGFYPRLLLRPETLLGWSIQIPVAKDKQYGTMKLERSPKEAIDALKAARDSKAPVDFVDIWGDTYKVYVTAVEEQAVEEHIDREGPYSDIEFVARINLVQVG